MQLSHTKLRLSEHFRSLQGEGKSAGTPSIFWRFQHCGGHCVFCDTVEVWKKGTAYTMEELYLLFLSAGYFPLLADKSHHLIITGGDPLIQQDQIVEFFDFCKDKGEPVEHWYVECENQGELMPGELFYSYINLWNISIKLANSGMSESKRIKPAIIQRYARINSAIFKFPVEKETDMPEIFALQERFSIPSGRIWLMPICSTREDHARVGAIVADLCMRFGYKFSARLQVVLWDKTVGV